MAASTPLPLSTGLGSREAFNIVHQELLNPHHAKTYGGGPKWVLQNLFAAAFVPVLAAGLLVGWEALYSIIPAKESTWLPAWTGVQKLWWALRPVTLGLIWVHVIVGFITIFSMYAVWMERKVSAHMQARVGPMEVGRLQFTLLGRKFNFWPKSWSPHGWLQTLADGLKLMAKEDFIPPTSDAWLFALAPIIAFTGVFVSYSILPFHGAGGSGVAANLDGAVYFFAAVTSIESIGVVMAGWASNNKWALFGAMRTATQVVSYELPLGLAVLLVCVASGTLDIQQIVADQNHGWFLGWNILRNPFLTIAFALYFVASLAETKRAPFDLPEAESELIAGYHTEYSSMRFSIFFLAEYASMYVVAAFAAAVFLGGWWTGIEPLDDAMYDWIQTGGLPLRLVAAFVGTFALVTKAMLLVFFQMAARWTYPRIRLDHVMYLCLKVMLPFAMAILLGGALWEVLLPDRVCFGILGR